MGERRVLSGGGVKPPTAPKGKPIFHPKKKRKIGRKSRKEVCSIGRGGSKGGVELRGGGIGLWGDGEMEFPRKEPLNSGTLSHGTKPDMEKFLEGKGWIGGKTVPPQRS